MKRLVLAALILTTAVGASAQFTSTDTLKYRISLTDKAATTYSIQQPEEFLSRKSIDRRLRQKLAIDSTDLPVCKKYVDAILPYERKASMCLSPENGIISLQSPAMTVC